MTEKQPKALECAEDLARFMRYLERIWGDDYAEFRTLTESEKELRRLHEVNLELLEALQLIAETDSIDAAFDLHRAIRVARAAIAKSTGGAA